MDLHIKTKYDIGQDVRLVYRNKQETIFIRKRTE